MKQRPSARLLILDAQSRVLLFRFAHRQGPLAGQSFWGTPGGGVDPGESFQQAAVRELFEETGIDVEEVGPQIDQRTAVFQLPNGEMVEADERYFLVRVASSDISQDGWTQLEREIMAEHRWWSLNELHRTSEQVFPQGLSRILRSALQKVGSA